MLNLIRLRIAQNINSVIHKLILKIKKLKKMKIHKINFKCINKVLVDLNLKFYKNN